jgi:hypothetical protein
LIPTSGRTRAWRQSDCRALVVSASGIGKRYRAFLARGDLFCVAVFGGAIAMAIIEAIRHLR